MSSSEPAWRYLRLIRSEPPGLASTSAHRRRTFAASLDQSEELWGASAVVGPAVSPIILYYGLTQASMAICAARLDANWLPPSSHGLKLGGTEFRDGERPELEKILVADDGRGLFQHVAAMLHSPSIPGGVSLAELVSCLPSLRSRPLDAFDFEHPPPLALSYGFGDRRDEDGMVHSIGLSVGPLPERLLHRVEREDRTWMMEPPAVDVIVEWLSAYPKLANLGTPVVGFVNSMDVGPDPMYFTVGLTWERTRPVSWQESGFLYTSLLDVSDEELVLPVVGGNSEPIHPLATWLALLYSFSMLARYFPRAWTQLLDVDRSTEAVPIETLLEVSKEQVPMLIAQALSDATTGPNQAAPS